MLQTRSVFGKKVETGFSFFLNVCVYGILSRNRSLIRPHASWHEEPARIAASIRSEKEIFSGQETGNRDNRRRKR